MNPHTITQALGRWTTGDGSLQRKLTHALMRSIREGLLAPGLRLPSERQLATALGVSRTTVVAAYDALRTASWLESRAGSGTWVCAHASVAAGVRTALHGAALDASPLFNLFAQAQDEDVINLALGTPLPLTDLSEDLFRLPDDEYRALLLDPLYYPAGWPPLRLAIAEHYTHGGLDTTPDQVLVTNGAQQAIALCAMLCLQRGDTALVEDPAYFGALEACRAIGARVSPLPVDAGGVRPAAIRDRLTATGARLIYLTPTFQNPTGAVTPLSARKDVARIVSEHGVPLIEDGTLADLILEGSPPPPIAAFLPDGPVFTIGSLSKLMWSGLRVGWIRAPESMIDRLARVKSAMDLSSPILTQAIATRLVGATAAARQLRQRQLKPRRNLLARLLRDQLPDWAFRVPTGGLFLWVRLPEGDAREFAQVALRHGVLVLAGPTMSAQEQHARFLRLPFLAPPDTLTQGVTRLVSAWRQYRSGNRPRRRHQVVA
jgi:DNA-binding transcriptional MocR family regulator